MRFPQMRTDHNYIRDCGQLKANSTTATKASAKSKTQGQKKRIEFISQVLFTLLPFLTLKVDYRFYAPLLYAAAVTMPY